MKILETIEKPKRPRDPEGTIQTKTRTVAAKRGTKEIEYFVVRVRLTDGAGRVRQKKKTCYSRSDALAARRNLRAELRAEVDAEISAVANPPEKTFFELLKYFEVNYVSEAKFAGGVKVSGQLDPVGHTRRMIKTCREFFGDVPVSAIDYTRLLEFKQFLMSVPVVVERVVVEKMTAAEIRAARQRNPKSRATTKKRRVTETRARKPATVHRILSKLRRIFSVGVQHDFLAISPFKKGDSLISIAIEETRVRICTFAEENRLHAVCTGERAHLKNILICAVDTFMRENELFSALWSDVDFERNCIRARKENTKTQKERIVPLTSRARAALCSLRATAPDKENGKIFGIQSAKRAWRTALRLTGIEDLHFHDLRATGITRMLDAGVREAVVMKFSGHEKFETFAKYVRQDFQMLTGAADALDALYQKQQPASAPEVPNEVPNVVGMQDFLDRKRAAS